VLPASFLIIFDQEAIIDDHVTLFDVCVTIIDEEHRINDEDVHFLHFLTQKAD
jgi:RecG-like helicase